MNFGLAIEVGRQTSKLTQADLASMVGVSTKYIYLLEHNERSPRLDLVQDIAYAFGVPVVALVAMAADTERERRIQSSPNTWKFISEIEWMDEEE